MSAADSVDRLSRRMTGDQDLTSWAKTPPYSVSGSHWERNIIDLAEAGEPRFVRILADHVKSGVIKSQRAADVVARHQAAA